MVSDGLDDTLAHHAYLIILFCYIAAQVGHKTQAFRAIRPCQIGGHSPH